MNDRRVSPVPAGSGIPGSIDGRPRPAWAIAARNASVREKSRQWTQSSIST
jgi:hypothetical protein